MFLNWQRIQGEQVLMRKRTIISNFIDIYNNAETFQTFALDFHNKGEHISLTG